MKSDTPRVDAHIASRANLYEVKPEFARELEREANAPLKVVKLFGSNEGTLFENEWRSAGISEEEEALIEAALAKAKQ